jgi:2-iminobutanoate/2-iminopropanoate deaminase
MTLFLKVMSDFPAVNAAINEAFPKNPPARSTVAVSDLPRNARVVVEVIAAQKPKT